VEMLFCSSLLALVGAGEQPAFSPRRLKMWNTKTKTVICELNFVSAIVAVKLNKRRLVVLLETKAQIFDFVSLSMLQTLDTVPNPKGLCALAVNNTNSYLALPASTSAGEVLVFDAVNLHAVNHIHAHKAPLASMAFNDDGSMLATASEKGTVIRVFSIPHATKLYTFRRGSYPAHIYSLSFDLQSTLLCVSSDSPTVHIFKLEQTPPPSATVAFVTAYLGLDALNDMLESSRDFAFVKLRVPGVPTLCAIDKTNTQVMVVTADGYFFQYKLDAIHGGECKLVKESVLLESASDQISAGFLTEQQHIQHV